MSRGGLEAAYGELQRASSADGRLSAPGAAQAVATLWMALAATAVAAGRYDAEAAATSAVERWALKRGDVDQAGIWCQLALLQAAKVAAAGSGQVG